MPTVQANGTTIAFARRGSGAPLLLIHGAEADHSMFDTLGALLAEHFTVIAYDQRDSGATRNPDAPYGLTELADDAATLVEALGFERAHVFGTSLGGVIAQVLAQRHPQRIDRLVLSSTFRAGVAPASLNPEVFARLAALRASLPGSASEIARYFFTERYLASHPEAAALFAGNRRDAAQKQRRAAILARPVAVDLGVISCPTLVLAAAEDRLIPPSHTLSLASELPDARTATIADAGHVAAIQDPEAVAHEVLAFLQARTTIGGNRDDHRGAQP
ncbi:alpha/beta fold hydrolase [Reyranella soli]|uniref:Alpha/beta hydrolase n=1 Tax=Reyranella soli TaxID=1230389 RepID=A0A512NHY9_9HYPH|nr:alpha/beta fold hydrolase [Reyranella soli]GEP58569.1 alpha/beta hydrolase [Reyranella soli]